MNELLKANEIPTWLASSLLVVEAIADYAQDKPVSDVELSRSTADELDENDKDNDDNDKDFLIQNRVFRLISYATILPRHIVELVTLLNHHGYSSPTNFQVPPSDQLVPIDSLQSTQPPQQYPSIVGIYPGQPASGNQRLRLGRPLRARSNRTDMPAHRSSTRRLQATPLHPHPHPTPRSLPAAHESRCPLLVILAPKRDLELPS
ncbi:hypothetical protein PCANC_18579 [Puccinia coronata f. sp. avenae]|uniref:Uncharacterized protein n=1 Tax=Puccinia coronata f. sp. avenae TaxID=200324 RepID=A0A2N5TME3_9BASI|nr:hypothetical protein PCANC_18579 [Puccinia coronata f. sp. avenae]